MGMIPRPGALASHTTAKVIYEEVFRGVDLVYYGKQRQLAYDFIIAPGANPDQIKLAFQGVDALRRDKRGNLLVESGGGSSLNSNGHTSIKLSTGSGGRSQAVSR